MRSSGHVAYDSFTQVAGGGRWPPWADLPEAMRQKWEAVANETLEWRYPRADAPASGPRIG